MFLTTNRTTSIDPAFKSRIDLILPYFDLDFAARKQVWKNFIAWMAPLVTERKSDIEGSSRFSSQLSEEDFEKMARVELNGREIKNSIKTSLVLAGRDGDHLLKMRHLQVVLKIRERCTM